MQGQKRTKGNLGKTGDRHQGPDESHGEHVDPVANIKCTERQQSAKNKGVSPENLCLGFGFPSLETEAQNR